MCPGQWYGSRLTGTGIASWPSTCWARKRKLDRDRARGDIIGTDICQQLLCLDISGALVLAVGRDGDGVDEHRSQAGQLIRARRQEVRLTQQQLAKKAGVSVGLVRDLEQGRTARPHRESVRRLASALGLNRQLARELSLAARGSPDVAARTISPGPSGDLRIGVLDFHRPDGLPAVHETGRVCCPPTSFCLGPRLRPRTRLTRKPCGFRVPPGCRRERGY